MNNSMILRIRLEHDAVCSVLFYNSILSVSIGRGCQDPFWAALTGGKFDFSSRYRYEHVDDNALQKSGATLASRCLDYQDHAGLYHRQLPWFWLSPDGTGCQGCLC